MSSIRDKFIKLAKQKGSRRDFVKLANEEGLTDKTEPAKKQKNNRFTKAFRAADKLNLEGKEKTKVFKNLYKLKKLKNLTPAGVIASVMSSKKANADEINMKAEDYKALRNEMKKGGLVKKGKPRVARKGWK